jgi:hypothetical protein
MAERAQTQTLGNAEDQYATREDFRKILDEDLNRLYQLSFLFTADRQKAERCFVAVFRTVLMRTVRSGNGPEPGRPAPWWKTQFVTYHRDRRVCFVRLSRAGACDLKAQ